MSVIIHDTPPQIASMKEYRDLMEHAKTSSTGQTEIRILFVKPHENVIRHAEKYDNLFINGDESSLNRRMEYLIAWAKKQPPFVDGASEEFATDMQAFLRIPTRAILKKLNDLDIYMYITPFPSDIDKGRLSPALHGVFNQWMEGTTSLDLEHIRKNQIEEKPKKPKRTKAARPLKVVENMKPSIMQLLFEGKVKMMPKRPREEIDMTVDDFLGGDGADFTPDVLETANTLLERGVEVEHVQNMLRTIRDTPADTQIEIVPQRRTGEVEIKDDFNRVTSRYDPINLDDD